ncbi:MULTISPECIES: hypothetical protein [Eubacterium]|jgi:hypothetical protein|uniref:Vanadium nitrogenase n=1 Tax=Eubacterium ruminantium TaxID=42322 RepID=A0A1T4LZG8_9FIRM|nr:MULTISPECIES: hypothetical protein [Eubacterium]MCR5367403.1 hypothetical protein [Eubacterium sp.]SCW38207.1 hypothetical protein SAMN05660484_00730 [Eubacterium ruminantium]SDM45049.1 hypothetical protein SAMN04490370_103170 [Eubacterium ruminantium]SJZ60056.1 hypothetical protein SAMN02745110_01022 [Eubacterium ruminantium]
MDQVLSEFATYIIKYLVFLVLAVLGFIAGTKWRKSKDMKTVEEAKNSEEVRS